MKKFLFVALLTFLLAFSFNAYSADKGLYMSGNIGMAVVNDSSLGTLDETDLEDIIGENLPAGSSASMDLEYDTGLILGAAVGYDFGSYRIESELAYQKSDIDAVAMKLIVPGFGSESENVGLAGDLTSYTILVNGYYDFLSGSTFQPYITAGIGYSFADAEIEGVSDDDTVFAYQIGAGIGYNMSENITWDLRYRYFKTPDDPMDLEYSSHSVTVGLRFYF